MRYPLYCHASARQYNEAPFYAKQICGCRFADAISVILPSISEGSTTKLLMAACYIYGITDGTACQSDELAGKNSVFIVIVHIEELKIVVIVIIHAGKVLCGGS